MRVLLFVLAMLAFPVHASLDPVVILQNSDNIRFPTESFQVDVRVISTNSENSGDDRSYKIISQGNVNSIIFTEEPAIDRGQTILMKGRDLWIFMLEISQPLRLSMSQRLTGQVANGDLARANFSGDYNPSLEGEEEIDGKKYWILDLKAVDNTVAYSRVKLWVDTSNNRPMKAEFYSLSGRILKTCQYLGFKQILGKMRPSKLVMTNSLKEGDVSTLVYTNMKLRDIPSKMFTKDYMKNLTNGI